MDVTGFAPPHKTRKYFHTEVFCALKYCTIKRVATKRLVSLHAATNKE